MKILFICRHNCFRSRVAEEYMKKISHHEIDSAGIIPAKDGPLDLQIKIAREYGLDITNKAKGLSPEFLNEQDIIINTADDVPSRLLNHPSYNKAKVINWDVTDVVDNTDTENKEIIENLIKKVEELNKELQ